MKHKHRHPWTKQLVQVPSKPSPLYSAKDIAGRYNLSINTINCRLKKAHAEHIADIPKIVKHGIVGSVIHGYTKEQVEKLFGPWGEL